MPITTLGEQRCLSGAMAKHAQEHAEPAYLALPFTLFNLNAQGRAAMAATMPTNVMDELIPIAASFTSFAFFDILRDFVVQRFGACGAPTVARSLMGPG